MVFPESEGEGLGFQSRGIMVDAQSKARPRRGDLLHRRQVMFRGLVMTI